MPDTKQSSGTRIHFECIEPILCVRDVGASVRFYVEVLGFENAGWGNEDFIHLSRDGVGIYLSRQGQGQAGAWVWIGVADVEALYEEFKSRGVIVRLPPTNYPWALEMQVEDPDGNVLRMGSDPK